jgi:hypothetical protein
MTLPFPHSWFQSLEYARDEYGCNPSSENRDRLAWAATMLSIKVDSWRLSEIVEEIDEEYEDKP